MLGDYQAYSFVAGKDLMGWGRLDRLCVAPCWLSSSSALPKVLLVAVRQGHPQGVQPRNGLGYRW